MLKFDSTASLEQWLLARGVDTSPWGRGAAKTVANLLTELEKGESELRDAPPLRSVNVVRVLLQRDDHILIEAAQGFGGGRRRERGRPPSEKMLPGEHFAAAALRCLHEELGLTPQQVALEPESYRRKEWRGETESYPGLPTYYTFHIVAAQAQGLPEQPFTTVEAAAGPGEPVAVHYWEWRLREAAPMDQIGF